MSTIQIRIDEKTKNSAKKVLDDVGMDMSSAIKVYLRQIVINKGIPFRLVTENGMTIGEEVAILNASGEARIGKNVKKVKGWSEAKSYLDSLK
ncbi:MAG: hypothetical protein ACD_65C00045G0003 [uncultured bacterium]|nr:MAG: hypothetical protein ACD_65C00045G0003 [uncultured bacterium]KKT02360.1 MAG: hypothetical protein UV80_C0004G0049 [Candidatus Peregrinibacteria bacterium GW2011_GWF2_43_17]KKT20299.1 MAG: Addiction module antitoxin, RelB/DinJ family [Candidatus Peregrinibacteria bacterium GW2011_GWA2_43_8]HAU39444.1 hypothetical protein [Candidatus Peregrinibacteria bacterium]